jgi:hypothetical protein
VAFLSNLSLWENGPLVVSQRVNDFLGLLRADPGFATMWQWDQRAGSIRIALSKDVLGCSTVYAIYGAGSLRATAIGIGSITE